MGFLKSAMVLAAMGMSPLPVCAEQPFLGKWALRSQSCNQTEALVSIGEGIIQAFGMHCRFSQIYERAGTTVFSGQCLDPDDQATYVGADAMLRLKTDGLYVSFVDGEEGTGPFLLCTD